MANDVSASFPEKWSMRMQSTAERADVFRMICSFSEEATLKVGDTVHRPYLSGLGVNDMGSDGSFTRQDITDTDESLSIDQKKEVSFYIQEIDEIQSNYDTMNKYADRAARALSNGIDGDVLAETANAGNDVDDADLGGTSGNGITLTESNVFDVFLAADEKLNRRNAPEEGRFAVLSPQFCKVLKSALIARESAWGDKVGENGYLGQYQGFDIYKSNGCYWTGVLSLVTTPTDGDTVTLNIPDQDGTRATITFTFKTTLGSTAGNVLIGGSADVARANLATLISAPGTTTANGVALTAANQRRLKAVAATNDNSADTLTLTAQGKGFVVVGETLTDATDTWTAATQIQHNLFGVKGCIEAVIQVKPNTEINHRDGYIGRDVVSWQVYGIKSFLEGTRWMVDVNVRSDAFTAS